MRIQVFNLYQEMAEKGNFEILVCPQHEDKIYILYPFINQYDDIFLECWACSFKLQPGIEMYRVLLEKLKTLAIDKIDPFYE